MRRESETTRLVGGPRTTGLSWPLAAMCIVDMFGVFPVIVLPRPIIDCGWVGLPMALLVGCLQIYTARLLGQCWILAEAVDPAIVHKSRYPYSAIAEVCFGPRIRMLVSFLLDVTLFGGGIPNLLVASQTLQLVGLKETSYGVNISFCYWLLILGVALCPLMWLGSPKDMKWIVVVSCVAVLSVAALTWTCIVLDDTAIVYPGQPSINWESVAIAYGVLAFQFDIHPMILTVQVDMADKNKLNRAIWTAFAVSGSLYVVTTALAISKYSTLVHHNLLQGLPDTALLYASLILATLQICLSLVVGGSPLFQDIEDKLNIPSEFNWRRCVLRSCVVLTSVLIAETVPRFDLVMGLLGGALTGPLMFIFPPLFYLKLKSKQHAMQRERQQRILLYEKPPPFNPAFSDGVAYHSRRRSDSEGGVANRSDRVSDSEGGVANHRGRMSDSEGGVANHRGRMSDSEGGEDDELCFEPVLPSVGSYRYYGEEFVKPRVKQEELLGRMATRERLTGLGWCAKLAMVMIIVMGVLATVAATYFSIRDTLKYAIITPACYP